MSTENNQPDRHESVGVHCQVSQQLNKIGDHIECYDPRIWYKRGYDLNHNEDCWKSAIIINIRYNVKCCEGMEDEHIHEILVDVQFDYDNYLSRGHFPSSIRMIAD